MATNGMTTTFYNDRKIWSKFCKKITAENPQPKLTGRPKRSSSQVLRDLMELYARKGEQLFK